MTALKSAEDRESAVSTFFENYESRGQSAAVFLFGHPRRTVTALRDLAALPALQARPAVSGEGPAVRYGLTCSMPTRVLFRSARAVLTLPDDTDSYLLGSARSKHTLRRKIRYAERAGVTWRIIDDPDERRQLARVADEHERTHAREQYRNTDPHSERMLDFRFWIAAFAADGHPIMLTVIPYDGEWGVLRYFRTLEDSPHASDTRYLLMKVLVEQLRARGVRYLADEASPQWLPGGLRHFQRMVGYRLARIDLR